MSNVKQIYFKIADFLKYTCGKREILMINYAKQRNFRKPVNRNACYRTRNVGVGLSLLPQ